MNPETLTHFHDLLIESLNCSFDCGQYQGDADSYKKVLTKNREAKERLINFVKNNLTEKINEPPKLP